jgi:hypothetical protein
MRIPHADITSNARCYNSLYPRLNLFFLFATADPTTLVVLKGHFIHCTLGWKSGSWILLDPFGSFRILLDSCEYLLISLRSNLSHICLTCLPYLISKVIEWNTTSSQQLSLLFSMLRVHSRLLSEFFWLVASHNKFSKNVLLLDAKPRTKKK